MTAKPIRTDLKAKDRDRSRRKHGRLITAVGVLLGAMAAAYASFEIYFFHDMPSLPPNDMLWTLGREPSVRILDRDGRLIAERGPRYGERVEYGELPSHLVQAVIATEDRRFWRHDGIDRRALLRALFANWRAGGIEQGGSTITQQLVKNLFLSPEQTLGRKLQEMRLAQRLEQRLTKPEILTLYLNRQYFGGQSYGVDAAARRYFNHSAREVTLSEAAMIAGLLKAPSRLDPSRSITDAQRRAQVVLTAMLDEGYITPRQQAEAAANPAVLLNPEDEEFASEYGYIIDAAVEEARGLLPFMAPDLVIRTTIDARLQRDAEQIIEDVLAENGETGNVEQAALLSMTPEGAIRALVGGRAYGASQFNRATQAVRQPGSAFKPIVFAAALEAGIRPNDVYVDQPIQIDDWQPVNYEGGHRGPLTVREAFKLSTNTVAAQIVNDIGPETVVRTAERFGISSEMEPVYSIALGSQALTLRELVGAYGVILNDGRLNQPYLVQQISDTRDDILYSRPEFEAPRVFDPALARDLRGMMSDVVNDEGLDGRGRGTGTAARPDGVDVAGKTGTSQDWRDAWFVGFSPRYVTGVWMGNDDYSPMNEIAGGGLPAVAWRRFVEAAHAEEPAGEAVVAEGLDLPERAARNPREAELAGYYGALARRFDAVASN